MNDNIDLKDGKPMMTSINADEPTRKSIAKQILKNATLTKEDIIKFRENPVVAAMLAQEYLAGYTDGANDTMGRLMESKFEGI